MFFLIIFLKICQNNILYHSALLFVQFGGCVFSIILSGNLFAFKRVIISNTESILILKSDFTLSLIVTFLLFQVRLASVI